MRVIDENSSITYDIDDLRIIKIFGSDDYNFLINKNEENQIKSYGFVYGKSCGCLLDSLQKITKVEGNGEGEVNDEGELTHDSDDVNGNQNIWTEIQYHKLAVINEPPDLMNLPPPYRYIKYSHFLNTHHEYIIFFQLVDPKCTIDVDIENTSPKNLNFIPLSSISDISDESASKLIFRSLQLFIKYYELTRSLLNIIHEDLILVSSYDGNIIILNLFLSLLFAPSDQIIAQSYPHISSTEYQIRNFLTINENILFPLSSLIYHPLLTLMLSISTKVKISIINNLINRNDINNANSELIYDKSSSNNNIISKDDEEYSKQIERIRQLNSNIKNITTPFERKQMIQKTTTIYDFNSIFTTVPISRIDNYLMEFGDVLLYSSEPNMLNKLLDNQIWLDYKDHKFIYDNLEFSSLKPKIVNIILRSKFRDNILYNQIDILSVDTIATNFIISKSDKLIKIFPKILYSKPISNDFSKNFRNMKIVDKLKNIYKVDLRGCDINDYSIKPIKRTFKKLENMKYFFLDNNNIGIKSIKFMCKSFGYWENLRHYHLNSCNIGNDGIRYLANNLSSLSRLSDLQISYNWIGNEQLTLLIRHLSSINDKRLYLAGNEIKDVGLKMFSKFPNYLSQLEEIVLSENLITAKGLASLNQEDISFNSLKILELSKTKTMMNFMEELVKLMKKMPLLEKLDLSGNEMEFPKIEVLIRSIKYVPKLETLILNNNLLKVRGIDLISSCGKYLPSFKTLDISKNDMKSDGFHFLIDNLKYLPKLENLDVSSNEIDESATSVFVANLKYITNLLSLNLSSNYFSKTCISELCDNNGWLPKLKYLDISYMNLCEDSVMAILKSLNSFPSLEILYFNAIYNYYIIDYSNPIYDPYRDKIFVVSKCER